MPKLCALRKKRETRRQPEFTRSSWTRKNRLTPKPISGGKRLRHRLVKSRLLGHARKKRISTNNTKARRVETSSGSWVTETQLTGAEGEHTAKKDIMKNLNQLVQNKRTMKNSWKNRNDQKLTRGGGGV